jgi:hypothetical protein
MLADDVAHLLEDFGSALVLTRPGVPVYNPVIGTTATTGGGSFTLRAVFINYLDENVNGTTIRSGDRRLLVSVQGSTTAPQIDDMVGGLKVIDVRTIAPNGTAIAYACQMRK